MRYVEDYSFGYLDTGKFYRCIVPRRHSPPDDQCTSHESQCNKAIDYEVTANDLSMLMVHVVSMCSRLHTLSQRSLTCFVTQSRS